MDEATVSSATAGPIARLIAASARQPFLTILAVLATFSFGVASLRTTPLRLSFTKSRMNS